MSRRSIVLGSVLMVLVAAVAVGALHHFYGGGTAQDSAGLDMVRTAGTLVVGVGGLFALLLAARRQRSTEQTLVHQYLTLEHQREMAATTARDAVEQRITELYTRAVDQLGAEKAPVRLGGLHALERLAQDNPTQRQTIVDVICAYLRMPYTPPDDHAPGEDASEDVHRRYEQRRQELQVRLTAQRILAAHLQPGQPAVFWAKIDLDLTGAYLQQLDLSGCQIRSAHFDGATFAGGAMFVHTTFGYAGFREVTFTGNAFFMGATFVRGTWFQKVTFAGDAVFSGATFAEDAVFHEVTFADRTVFDGVEFTKDAKFDGVRVAQSPVDVALDESAKLGENIEFPDDVMAFIGGRGPPYSLNVNLPSGWTTRAAQPSKGEDESWLYVVRDQDSSKQPTEATDDEED
jgi:Pentapeptide repeats (9 copies)/Pentapeptide repeats (8 copies)